jgi:retinaldehyde-binding protein 1
MSAAEPGAAVTSISGATLEKARRELFEVPAERLTRLAELRGRIAEAEKGSDLKGVVFARQDDRFLLRFLRARKFDVERSLQLYLNYYKYRHKHAHLLGEQSVSSVEHVLRRDFFALLDTPTKAGSKVLVVFPRRVDLDKIPAVDCFKTLMLILDALMEDEETQVHGISMIIECGGLSLFEVMKASTSEFARSNVIFDLVQAFPARFKSLHLVHQPWYISIVYKLAKPFIKPKFKDRVRSGC